MRHRLASHVDGLTVAPRGIVDKTLWIKGVHQLTASTPDGRVILVGVPHPEGLCLVDLTGTGPAAIAGTRRDDPARALRLDGALWLDARTAVVGGHGGVARITVTNVGTVEWFPVGGDVQAVPVPRLGTG